MHSLFSYDLCIFDCDGVILDSNDIKINAMEKAVVDSGFSFDLAMKCKDYFSNNFGKSRFFHIRHFVEEILAIDKAQQELAYQKILENFSQSCREQYFDAPITPGFCKVLNLLNAKKAVASGSEQEELRELFKFRSLSDSFECILGSPAAKVGNVATILQTVPHSRAVMIGDSVADFEAAVANAIDFIAYLPFSNVAEQMDILAEDNGFVVLNEWPI